MVLAGMVTALVALTSAVRVEVPLYYEQFGWVERAAPRHEPVSFTISLHQRNIPELKRRAIAVSTPGHPSYGAFLSNAELDKLTAPSPEVRTAIAAWLAEYNVHATFDRELVHCRAPVGVVSALLHTTFALYQKDSKTLVRASSGYSLPDHVAKHVATIFGLHGIPAPRPAKPTAAAPSVAKVTPAVLASTYSIGTPYVDRAGKGVQAVAEFQGQYMSKADLETFFKAEVPAAQPGDEQVSKFVGVPYKEGTGVEALLDIEFIMGVAPGVKTEFWEWPESDFCGDLHNYTATMLAAAAPPLSNSISYGWQGDLAQLHCQPADLDVVDTNWAKLAAKGISIMISSGDSGSGYVGPTRDPNPPNMAHL